MWAGAAAQPDGNGLQEGADLTVVWKHLRRLRMHGADQREGLLLTVVQGGDWTRQRKADTFGGCALCPRCKKAPGTRFHRTYECEANAQIEGIEETNKIVDRATKLHERDPAFWFRGMVPRDWTHFEVPDAPGLAQR